ncbi:MAG: DUF1127 domain-containing protein [Alphaproteobacteria bacterium]|nr:DUF1127 domain-containing protein [Alphaproteobacteria bacterium]MCW5741379.1 DUF1127 domain-containing protein [Alphaproteobacteria bacterium]
MALVTDSLIHAPAPKASFVGQLTVAATAAFDWLFRRLELARSRADLLEMDDRMLADIGLDRATAKSEGQRGFWG